MSETDNINTSNNNTETAVSDAANDFNPNAFDVSQYSEHFAIAAKGKGCSEELLGRVVLVAFLINDTESAWNEEAVNSFVEVLKKSADEIQRQSNMTKNRLDVCYAYKVVNIPFKYDRFEGNQKDVVTSVLSLFGYKTAGEYQKHYEEKFNRNEAPLLFVFNRDFRSNAIKTSEKERNPLANEWSIISFVNVEKTTRTVIHEVLHQFGAIDYYLPQSVKNVADELFPNSIMDSGNEIDEFTRYVIGWDKVPSEKAALFIENTKNVTEEEIRDAKEKDKDNDW